MTTACIRARSRVSCSLAAASPLLSTCFLEHPQPTPSSSSSGADQRLTWLFSRRSFSRADPRPIGIDDGVFPVALAFMAASSSCSSPRISACNSMIFYDAHTDVRRKASKGAAPARTGTYRLHEVLLGRAALLLVLEALDQQRYLLAQRGDVVLALVVFVGGDRVVQKGVGGDRTAAPTVAAASVAPELGRRRAALVGQRLGGAALLFKRPSVAAGESSRAVHHGGHSSRRGGTPTARTVDRSAWRTLRGHGQQPSQHGARNPADVRLVHLPGPGEVAIATPRCHHLRALEVGLLGRPRAAWMLPCRIDRLKIGCGRSRRKAPLCRCTGRLHARVPSAIEGWSWSAAGRECLNAGEPRAERCLM
jgi:hypothetical protein